MVCRLGGRLDPIRRCMKSSVLPATVRFFPCVVTFQTSPASPFTDIAVIGKKVVEFYVAKGGEVVSPLVKAF